MKYLLILIFLFSCAHKPKYKVGDCVSINTLHQPHKLKSGNYTFLGGTIMSSLQILEIKKLGKTEFYVAKIKDLWVKDWWKTYRKELQYFPVKDLDNFRLANLVWEPKESKPQLGCNYYGE